MFRFSGSLFTNKGSLIDFDVFSFYKSNEDMNEWRQYYHIDFLRTTRKKASVVNGWQVLFCYSIRSK